MAWDEAVVWDETRFVVMMMMMGEATMIVPPSPLLETDMIVLLTTARLLRDRHLFVVMAIMSW